MNSQALDHLPVGCNEEVWLAFRGLDLRDIEVQESNRVTFETLSLGLVYLHVRKSGYSVTLKAAMQSVSDKECWPAGGIKAVIQRQQHMPLKIDCHGFFGFFQTR